MKINIIYGKVGSNESKAAGKNQRIFASCSAGYGNRFALVRYDYAHAAGYTPAVFDWRRASHSRHGFFYIGCGFGDDPNRRAFGHALGKREESGVDCAGVFCNCWRSKRPACRI